MVHVLQQKQNRGKTVRRGSEFLPLNVTEIEFPVLGDDTFGKGNANVVRHCCFCSCSFAHWKGVGE